QVLEEVYPYFTKLGMLVESIINDCLDLPPNFLKEYNDDRSWDVLLALHYVPAISNTEINIGKTCHTDASSVTFVFQDGVEGLEFYRDGKWIPVVPPHGTLVINIGDLIQLVTVDELTDRLHFADGITLLMITLLNDHSADGYSADSRLNTSILTHLMITNLILLI
ncbi:hypothetical protein RD792_017906, partial [Penstemon davidsonii]